MERFFGGPVIPTIVKLALISFAVGIVLWISGIDPLDLWRNLGQTIKDAWQAVADFVDWGAKYAALGAIVVIPIWLVFRLFRVVMGSRKTSAGE